MSLQALRAAEKLLERQRTTLLVCDRLIHKLKQRPDWSTISLLIEQLRPLYKDYRWIRDHTRNPPTR